MSLGRMHLRPLNTTISKNGDAGEGCAHYMKYKMHYSCSVKAATVNSFVGKEGGLEAASPQDGDCEGQGRSSFPLQFGC